MESALSLLTTTTKAKITGEYRMSYLTDVAAEEFTVYTNADCVYDWSSDSDEAGMPVFDLADLSEQLRIEEY
jgi:hypothetical protein